MMEIGIGKRGTVFLGRSKVTKIDSMISWLLRHVIPIVVVKQVSLEMMEDGVEKRGTVFCGRSKIPRSIA